MPDEDRLNRIAPTQKKKGDQPKRPSPDIEMADADVILNELDSQLDITVTKSRPGVIDGNEMEYHQLSDCPFVPNDTHTEAATLMVFENGKVGFRCQGGRCKAASHNLRSLLEHLGMERRAVPTVVPPTPMVSKLKWVPLRVVRTESLDFMWDGRLVVGHLNLLLGNEKVGKGVLEARLVEMATTGKLSLDGRPLNVAIASSEDRYSTTLKPRLIAAGADIDRVTGLHGLTFPDELPFLEAGCLEMAIDLLWVDPIHSHFGRGLNYAESKDTNYVLNALADSCDRIKLTTVGNIHTNRTAAASTRARMAHSMEFGRVARSTVVLGIAPDGADNERLVGHDMVNYSARAYVINAEIVGVPVLLDDGKTRYHPVMNLDGRSDFTVDQILAQDIETEQRQKARAEAESQWKQCATEMRRVQQRYGSLEVPAKKFARIQSNYSNDTLYRAKRHLGVQSRRDKSNWRWVFVDAPPVDLREDDPDDIF